MFSRLPAQLALVLCALSVPVFSEEKPDLPLIGDVPFNITLTEATWLSIDVSPDGDQLIMEVLGDLYLLPIAGGEATLFSGGAHFDSQPKFSPDGKHIAFISDRSGEEGVWVQPLEGGEARKLTGKGNRIEFASPTWSPDGRQVVASRTVWDLRTFELWSYSIDGGTGVRITQAKATPTTPAASRHNALGAEFDPTGRYIYYARKQGGFGYNLRYPIWQVARRDLYANKEDIVTNAQGSGFRPKLSPDGRYLVYGTRHEHRTGLRIRDLSNGADECLAYPVQLDEQESRYTRDLLPGYAFTPDGESLIFTKAGKLARLSLRDKTIKNVPFTVNVSKQLVSRLDFKYRTATGPVKARILADATLSPDQDQVAFTAFGRIYVHTLASGKTVQVSPEDRSAAMPAWSPKGDALVYVSWEDEGGHIYRSKVREYARPKQLTRSPAYYQNPVWSPDGKRIIALQGSATARRARFHSSRPVPAADVILLDAKGGESTVILPARGFGRPHFGPEDDRIYLQIAHTLNPGSTRAGLISIRMDGTEQRGVVRVSGPGYYNQGLDVGAEQIRISPDGSHVLILHHSQLYLAQLIANLPNQTIKLSKSQLPLAQVTDIGADSMGWSADGKTIHWGVGNRIYQRRLDSFDFLSDEQDDQENADDAEGEPQSGSETVSDAVLEDHEAVVSNDIDLYRARHQPEGVVALTNATVLTMSPMGTLENGTIVIERDRIVAVGPGDEIDVPANADVIDLGGRVVSPGFVDTHAHFRVSRGVHTGSSASMLANLAYGVTTGIDVQPQTVDVVVIQDMIDAGMMLGPRAFSTGPGVFNNNEFKSKQHAFAVLKRYKEFYKVNNIKAYLSGSRLQRQWLIQAARELKIMPTTEGGLDMKLNVSHILDGFSGLEHNFPIATLSEDIVQLVAQTRVAYTPTLLVAYGGPWTENYYYTHHSPHHDPKLRRFTPYNQLATRTLRRNWVLDEEYAFKKIAASSKAIVDAGGKVGIGSHGQLQGLGYHWELWSVAAGGYDNLAALELATIGGAAMLGLAEDLGSLEVGKLADLLVYNQDPRQNLMFSKDLKYVMKGGDLYEADTLNQVWPVKRELPPQWWWQDTPTSVLPKQE